MFVDAHNHLVAEDLDKYPATALNNKQGRWSKNMHLSADDFLALMDEAGIEKAVIVQGATAHGYDNSYLADSIEIHRDRLVGVGTINPLAEDVVQTMRYWITERGLQGLRLYTRKQREVPLDDSAMEPYWESASELGVPVSFQVSLDYLPRVHTVLNRYPDLHVIMESLGKGEAKLLSDSVAGGPPYGKAENFFKLAEHSNLVAVKFMNNAWPNMRTGVGTPEEFVKAVSSTFGAERMLWGTNYPTVLDDAGVLCPYKALVDEAQEVVSGLSVEDRNWVLGGTAVSLFSGLA